MPQGGRSWGVGSSSTAPLRPTGDWDPDAAQEPGALLAGHGQGWWAHGSVFGIGNVWMASCPGQPSAPPSAPPGTRRGATAASPGSTSCSLRSEMLGAAVRMWTTGLVVKLLIY